MLARLRAKVNKVKHKVYRVRGIVEAYSTMEGAFTDSHRGRVNITILLRLLKIDIATKIELVTQGSSTFLVVYQKGKDDPDYTIRVKGSDHE